MELEAENLWIHSASHDFYDKTIFIKKYYFFLVEKFFEKLCVISKNIFLKIGKSRKFSLKTSIKIFKKSRKKISKKIEIVSKKFGMFFIDFQ